MKFCFSNYLSAKNNSNFSLKIILVLLLQCFLQKALAQDKTVQILNSNEMQFIRHDDGDIKKLTGNVILKQGDVTMWCDSALFMENNNSVKANGNVKLKQGDSITLFCQELNYYGNDKKLNANKKVRLIKGSSTLLTDNLDYDMKTKTGWYLQGGRLMNDSTLLISKIGYYHAGNGDAYFKEKVKVTNPHYSLLADSFMYNVNTKTNFFTGATHITTDSNKVYCEGGYYSLLSGDSRFINHAHIISKTDDVLGNRIDFNAKTGIGAAFGDVQFYDSVQKIIITAGEAHFNRHTNFLKAFQFPVLQTLMDKDTLFIHADTLTSFQQIDSIHTKDTFQHKLLLANYHVKMFSKKFQALCDSASYNFSDSAFHLFYAPILWAESNQLTGDTIFIFTKRNKIHHLNLMQKAMIVNKLHPKLFNQVAGKFIVGYFENNELKQMTVDGNAESVYYSTDSKSRYTGVNKSSAGRMRFEFKEGKMDKIFFYEQPDATFYPMKHLDFKQINLKNMNWFGNLRPTLSQFKSAN